MEKYKNDLNFLQYVLENSPDGIFVLDMNLEIQFVNQEFCRLLGCSEDNLLGGSMLDFIGNLEILNVCMSSVLQNGFCNDQETIFRRKDGAEFVVSKNVRAVYDEQGEIKNILVSIRDMTKLQELNKLLEKSNIEQKMIADELRAAQKKLVEAEKMAAVGGMISGLSHEINTPIGVCVTVSSSLDDEVKILESKFLANELTKTDLGNFIDFSKKTCDLLNNNLKRTAGLIGHFKQVSLEKNSEDEQEIKILDFIQSLIADLKPTISADVSVLLSGENFVIKSYPVSLYQSLSNILLNAVVHAFPDRKDKKIDIKVGRGVEEKTLLISIWDNGVGMPPEVIKRAFEPFFTTKRGAGGTGLGLSIVYNIITSQLGGDINIVSSEFGSVFNITLPMTIA